MSCLKFCFCCLFFCYREADMSWSPRWLVEVSLMIDVLHGRPNLIFLFILLSYFYNFRGAFVWRIICAANGLLLLICLLSVFFPSSDDMQS
uniref:Uncharacterized protein n=1 Tax=Arundo donax TaxID=35708 RepID=A0A0A8XYW3_ARUDO